MPPVRSSDQPIEVRIERRQVTLISVAVLVLFGAVFSLGVLVGRQIASSSFAAPQQPPAGDLAALDAASRAPKAPEVVAPPPDEDAKAEAKDEHKGDGEPGRPVSARPGGPSQPPFERKADGAGSEAADDDEPAPKVKAPPAELAMEPKVEPKQPAPEPGHKPAQKEKPGKAVRASEAGRFTVQLGASPDQKVAQKLQAKASAAGFDVHILEVDLGAKGTWYRVRVGSFANKDDAAKVQKDAERQLRAPAVVMPAQ